MSSEDSPVSATSSTTTEENCNIYDEINNEADLATEVDSSVPTNTRNLPFQTKIPNENLARLIKDDQSSDGYHTPVEG
jgi:phosphoglycerol transferase MdoB-like AlkP superfamily enzyme